MYKSKHKHAKKTNTHGKRITYQKNQQQQKQQHNEKKGIHTEKQQINK